MPSFTADDVRRLARLAQLELTEDEVALFTTQLADVLEFARQVQAVEPVGSAAPGTTTAGAPRLDVVAPSLPREEALASAPDAGSGLFKVPRVLGP